MSDLLSKAPERTATRVEGFLDDRELKWGKHKKIKVGKVFHNFHCKTCDDQRTFESGDELYCLGLDEHTVSIDATLRCTACQSSVETWYLVASNEHISGFSPEVRIERYTENLRDRAERIGKAPGQFGDLVRRAQIAYDVELGAGAMVYLRWILESITYEVAEIAGIPTTGKNNKRLTFKDLLERVNEERRIIPQRFSSNGYKLFGELSEIIHGNSTEEEALKKFKPCLQLVLGVVEEVNRDNVFAKAIDELGWGADDIDEIAGDAS
ncbi:hypothetical protein ACF09G_08210 [Streptomyces albogriseolus]|uniref:hypothetical protein n=1 Tax=Streptomyces albogriseolus TaxID=1887 RepID=UPI003702D353